jgi:hypothetical protein
MQPFVFIGWALRPKGGRRAFCYNLFVRRAIKALLFLK